MTGALASGPTKEALRQFGSGRGEGREGEDEPSAGCVDGDR